MLESQIAMAQCKAAMDILKREIDASCPNWPYLEKAHNLIAETLHRHGATMAHDETVEQLRKKLRDF